ncbi:MAG: N-(5'-phosphoribosyl)anthranilate isomerase [Planctomycetota bacterium]|nr:MAG: N-(5'-phosphoribosyl)anthranilate isomerase [Planctomycetota bacterium]
MKVKICGISHRSDVVSINQLKPDFMGFVIDYPASVRSVTSDSLHELLDGVEVPIVFLFVNTSIEEILKVVQIKKPFAIQLHGDETKEFVNSLKPQIVDVQIWKALHLPPKSDIDSLEDYLKKITEYVDAGCHKIILDSSTKENYGGTGIKCDWDLAAKILEKSNANIFLAGGLTAENVNSAVQQVSPMGVDVSSGVEESKSNKDIVMVEDFILNAKSEK